MPGNFYSKRVDIKCQSIEVQQLMGPNQHELNWSSYCSFFVHSSLGNFRKSRKLQTIQTHKIQCQEILKGDQSVGCNNLSLCCYLLSTARFWFELRSTIMYDIVRLLRRYPTYELIIILAIWVLLIFNMDSTLILLNCWQGNNAKAVRQLQPSGSNHKPVPSVDIEDSTNSASAT